MIKRSKDISDEEAFNTILELKTEQDVRAFAKGEQREAVMDAAVARINQLKTETKQGETGPITKHTSDFKGPGVERTKSADTETGGRGDGETKPKPITGENVIAALDADALKRANELAAQNKPAEEAASKSEAEIRRARGIVTGEDAIAKMRAEGKKI